MSASELATSRFQDFDERMGVPVRTTLGRPRMPLAYEYEEIRLLAPTPRIFRIEDPQEFEREYRAHLERVGLDRLRSVFEEMSDRHGGKRLVLLCFEDVLKGQGCHRRTFAGWWKEKTGEEVREIDPYTGEMVL